LGVEVLVVRARFAKLDWQLECFNALIPFVEELDENSVQLTSSKPDTQACLYGLEGPD
jgi:hypothetical protein